MATSLARRIAVAATWSLVAAFVALIFALLAFVLREGVAWLAVPFIVLTAALGLYTTIAARRAGVEEARGLWAIALAVVALIVGLIAGEVI